MSRATNGNGTLQKLAKFKIITPYKDINSNTIVVELRILPDITDSKSANYINETIPGRSTPPANYSHSEARMISTELPFMTTCCQDIHDNLFNLRVLESLVYPGDPAGGAPYTPPPVCKLICGLLLGDSGVCVVMKSYSVKFPTDVAWDTETYLPYKFSVSCQWEVVYACKSLPTYQKIMQLNSSWPCPPRNTDIN